jgi:putative membrane protein
MTLDLILASGHHLLVFSLMAIIAAEMVMVRTEMGGREIRRLSGVDRMYGILATLVIVVGLLRVFFGIKGAGYYWASPSFWAKMGTFIVVALVSIAPTIRFARWRRAAEADPAFTPPADELRGTRRMIHIEAGIFLLIPVFAAAMARGF